MQLSELFLSYFDGSCIVFTQQGQDLHQILWIVQIVDLLNCVSVAICLVIGWQQNSEGELRLTINGWSAVQPGLFRFLPNIETQPNIKDGLSGHQANNCKIDILESSNDCIGHVVFLLIPKQYLSSKPSFHCYKQYVASLALPAAH